MPYEVRVNVTRSSQTGATPMKYSLPKFALGPADDWRQPYYQPLRTSKTTTPTPRLHIGNSPSPCCPPNRAWELFGDVDWHRLKLCQEPFHKRQMFRRHRGHGVCVHTRAWHCSAHSYSPCHQGFTYHSVRQMKAALYTKRSFAILPHDTGVSAPLTAKWCQFHNL